MSANDTAPTVALLCFAAFGVIAVIVVCFRLLSVSFSFLRRIMSSSRNSHLSGPEFDLNSPFEDEDFGGESANDWCTGSEQTSFPSTFPSSFDLTQEFERQQLFNITNMPQERVGPEITRRSPMDKENPHVLGNTSSRPPPPPASTCRQHGTSQRGVNWTHQDILALLEGKKVLDDLLEDGTLREKVKTKAERWEFVHQHMLRMGIVHTAKNCSYKWNRLLAPFKQVFDYERSIPSGRGSYWTLSNHDRAKYNLPRRFDKEIYESMSNKFAGNRNIDPGDILIDSNDDDTDPPPSVEGLVTPPPSDVPPSGPQVIEVSSTNDPNNSTGHRRKRPMSRTSTFKKDLDDSTKKLLDFFESTEKTREQSKQLQFERTFAQNEDRIVEARLSTKALFIIARSLDKMTSTSMFTQ